MYKALLLSSLTILFILSPDLPAQGILYVGNTRVDLDFGHFNDANLTKVEIYRDQTKIGQMVNGGSGLVYYSDKGLQKGKKYYYSQKKYKADNTTETVGLGFIQTGEVRGYLVQDDEQWDSETVIMDSVVVIFGTLTIAPGAAVKSGTRQFQTKININSFGALIATGGSIREVNIDCFGQFGPLRNLTITASDILLHSDKTSFMENCILDETPVSNNPVYLYTPGFSIEAHKVTVRGGSELRGVALAESCTVEAYSIIVGSTMRHMWVKESGIIALRPNDVPTICELSKFDSSQALSVGQMSTVRRNTFKGLSTIQISALAAGFPKNEVGDIHINYNTFSREGGDVSLISNTDADSVDATRNYWGIDSGPDADQRRYKLFLDPYLRVPYDNPSYWLQISPDKNTITANGQDRVTFRGRMYEVLSGNNAVDSIVSYQAITFGDTISKGNVKVNANGQVEFSFVLPSRYSTALAVLVKIQSIQGIRETFILNVSSASGPDLEIDNVQIIQIQAAAPGIIAEKPFAVKVDITTSDIVDKDFQVELKIGGKSYYRFYRLARSNINDDFSLKTPEDSLNLPNGESLTLYFFPNVSDLASGTHTITVVIDPPDSSSTYGRVLEADENNNEFTRLVNAKRAFLGNEINSPNLSVLFQPFEYPVTNLGRFNIWTDSAVTFMRSVWPMKPEQLVVTKASDIHYTSQYLSKPTLLDTTFESYFVKAYKLLRRTKPSFDRYILSVPDDWFFTRMDPYDFEQKMSTSMSFSGIPDLVVARVHQFKSPIHELGHTFGLRRTDYGDQEEYMLYNAGKQVIEGIDFNTRRLKDYGINSISGKTQEVLCFMSNSSYNFGREYWICDTDYEQLYNRVKHSFQRRTGFSKESATDAMLITGTVDTTGTVVFGAWDKLQNATPSLMSDSASSPYVFRTYDASNTLIGKYFYRPTFTALSLDEGITPAPVVPIEHFAFVIPFPVNAMKVTVDHDGSEVVSRTLTANPPTVNILFPTAGKIINQDTMFVWSGSDIDGGTLFYTLSISKDGGLSWQILAMDITQQELELGLNKYPNGAQYKIRVEASDGILTGSATSEMFTIDSNVGVEGDQQPMTFTLKQNYPNPFNATTVVQYDVLSKAHVVLDITDVLGRVVRTLVDDMVDPGSYTTRINAYELTNGMYFVRLRSGSKVEMKRMVVSR